MFRFRNVLKPDGRIHMEQEIGSMRFDLTDGALTQKVGRSDPIQPVIRPDGSYGMEQTVGTMRFNLDRPSSGFDQFI